MSDASLGVIISGERRLEKTELDRRARQAAQGFTDLGIGPNDAVALFLRNDFAFFEASFGAALLGAYPVPINWHYTPEETAYVLEDCAAKAVVAHADLLGRLEGALPDGCTLLVVQTPPEIVEAYGLDPARTHVPEGLVNWDVWREAREPWQGSPAALRGAMIYTSGTTGRPKGVRREPQTPEMQAIVQAMAKTVFDLSPEKPVRTVVTGPMYHTAPNGYAMNAVRYGGYVVLQPRFDAEGLLKIIDEHRITHIHMVPTMFVRLLKLPEEVRNRYDVSTLKFVVHAAAPCPPSIKRQMIEWWGPVINEYYGSTETSATNFHTSEEALRRAGTVGRTIPGAVVKIFDDEGKELAPNEIGTIYGRIIGSADFTYHGRRAERDEIEREGLITSGDMGYIDEDGYLFLCDRKKDMVISGGVNIYPAEIEAVLHQMPGVHDCAVFGIPDEEFGESLAAYIEPDPGTDLTPENVQAYCRKHMAGYKVPKVVKFARNLPREDSGKIFKRKLREPYWAEAGRRI
ncbi:MAG TPA: acyl-CoA synthetase [Alphaproteobacteria bacterium]|nr:acyl-CoA synthetase [Alphaproteobacteria bacterium]